MSILDIVGLDVGKGARQIQIESATPNVYIFVDQNNKIIRRQKVLQKKSYKHLSEKERVQIAILRKRKICIREIARELGRDPSTISRELGRNKWSACLIEYNSSAAQNSYKKKMSQKAMNRNGVIWLSETQKYIEEKLKIGWAPQTISGRMKLEKNPLYVSHETIYKHIYRYRPDLIKHLRWYKPKKYFKRGKKSGITNIVGIENRQAIVKERKEFGHYEADSVISGQKGKSILKVLSRFKWVDNLG